MWNRANWTNQKYGNKSIAALHIHQIKKKASKTVKIGQTKTTIA